MSLKLAECFRPLTLPGTSEYVGDTSECIFGDSFGSVADVADVCIRNCQQVSLILEQILPTISWVSDLLATPNPMLGPF